MKYSEECQREIDTLLEAVFGAQRAVLFIVFQVNHFRGTAEVLQEELTVLLLITLISVQGFPLGNQVQQAFESEDFLT